MYQKPITAQAILYEDNHIIILNKKPSELVQGDKTGDITLLEKVKNYLKQKYNKPGKVYLGLVHRLDRPTSGIVIFAKTSKVLVRLNAMLQRHEIEKIYWAITPKINSMPQAETHTVYLKKNEVQNKSYVVSEKDSHAKKAILHYALLAQIDHYQLLKVKLQTGRHHQIRCQLAHLGIPIVGDLKYGYKRSNPDASICLHAQSVSFIHPVSKLPLTIIAPIPQTKPWQFFTDFA